MKIKNKILALTIATVMIPQISFACSNEVNEIYLKNSQISMLIEKCKEEIYRKKEVKQMIKNVESFRNDMYSSPIYNPVHITYISSDGLNKLLENTGLENLGESFYKTEENYGINSVFLISLAMLESGNGYSRIATEKNNLFGYNSNDSNPYGDSFAFETKEDCIDYVADSIKRNYLSSDGKFFNGYSIEAMNINYCSKDNWHEQIKDIMYNLYCEINERDII